MTEQPTHDWPNAEPVMQPKVKRILIIAGIVIILSIPLVILFSSAPKSKNVPATEKKGIDIATLEQQANSNPTSANIVALSVAYINNNTPGKAIKPLTDLIKREPNNAIAYNNLGVANIMVKNYQAGIDACSKALQIDTGFQLAKNNLRWGLDEKKKALTTIQAMEKIMPDKQDQAYFIQLGLLYMQIGNYEKSVAIWKEGQQKFPSAAAIFYNNMGTAQVLNKEYDKAIENFNKAINADANNQLAKNNLAWALQEKKDNTPQ